MSDTLKKPKVFLDTSVILAGLNSPLGGSGAVLALGKLGRIVLAVSPEVIEEVERNIKNKFPLLSMGFVDFMLSTSILTKTASPKELKSAYRLLPTEDAPIFAAARKAQPDFLLTLDKEFERLMKNFALFKICSPGEFLQQFRDS